MRMCKDIRDIQNRDNVLVRKVIAYGAARGRIA